MTWQVQLHGDPLPWLLEPDAPGVRYLALRDLLSRPAHDPEQPNKWVTLPALRALKATGNL